MFAVGDAFLLDIEHIEEKEKRMIKRMIKRIDEKYCNGVLRKIKKKIKPLYRAKYYKTGQDYPYRGYEAMDMLLKKFKFSTVLDVGCGQGVHSEIFLQAGKEVTALDYGESVYFRKMKKQGGGY